MVGGEDRTSVTSVFFITRPDLSEKNDSEDFFNVRLRIAHRDPDSAHVRTTLRRGTSLPLLPAMNSSDYRPTKDTERPRTDGAADDRTPAWPIPPLALRRAHAPTARPMERTEALGLSCLLLRSRLSLPTW